MEKEVASVENVFSADGINRYVHINVNRAGIYDTLPEGIFHKPACYNQFSDVDDLKSSIQRNRAVQKAARKLLAPMDVAFNETRFRLLCMEIELAMGDRKLLGNILGEWCDDLTMLDNEQLWRWIGCWSKIAEIRNDAEMITACLQQVLGIAVVCRFVPAAPFSFQTRQCLGQMNLGFDTALSGSCYNEGTDLQISINVRNEKELQYLQKPEGGIAALDRLIQYLAGADIQVRKEIRMKRSLVPDGEEERLYVGINTFL